MKFVKILRFLVLALVAGGVGAGLYFWRDRSTAAFIAIKPVYGPAVQAVYATGTVEPTIMLPIAPRSGARLMGLLADEGQNIKKGDILAQLEDTDIQKSIDELQARLTLAEKEYERMQGLAKAHAVSVQELDQARTGREAAQAALEKARAEQSYLRLFAPENGRIIRRDGEVGEFITAGQPVFWMECCAPLRITAEVDEEDIALVQPGQKVVISADAFPGQIFHGTLTAITPKGDAVSRSYRVRIGLDADTPLMTGMTAETNIIVRESQNALLVPISALSENSLWIVKDGKLQARAVSIGIKNDDVAEITQGLSDTDMVLKSPPGEIKEGQAVPVRSQVWKPKS